MELCFYVIFKPKDLLKPGSGMDQFTNQISKIIKHTVEKFLKKNSGIKHFSSRALAEKKKKL